MDDTTAATLRLWGTLVGQVGFPIFVAVYLLTRLDRVLRALVASVGELVTLMRVQTDTTLGSTARRVERRPERP